MSELAPTIRRNRARGLRRTATEAERRLWWHLRHRLPLHRTYFRRQVPVGPYFADFCCLTLKIIVEVDGDRHGRADAMAYDEARSAFLKQQGFLVLRFWNCQVFREIDSVLDTIHATISSRDRSSSQYPADATPAVSPLPCGEG